MSRSTFREREREYDNQKNTIVVADSYQARVGTLATILEYLAIRHRYSDKENEFAEEVERALQSLTSLMSLYNFDLGQGYCK